MCFSGYTALHGFMMSVHAGIVVDLESGRRQGFCDLVDMLSASWYERA